MEGLEFEPLSHTYWATNSQGEREMVPSVTAVIGMIQEYYRLGSAALAPYAARGTEVHTLTEQYDRDPEFDLDIVAPERAGFLLAWINFRNDFGFVPTHIEHRVFHPRLFYAGTLDRVGVIRGKQSVLDIKTSAKLGPAVGVQLAAYQHAFTDAEIEGRFAVQLIKDGTYRVVEYANPADWDCFRGCLALYGWQKDHQFRLADVRPRVVQPDFPDEPGTETSPVWAQFSRTATRSI